MKLKRILVATLALAISAAACTASPSGDRDQASDQNAESSEVEESESTSTTEPCDVEPKPLALSDAPAVSPEGLVALSAAVFDCVETVVVVQAVNSNNARFAAETAIEAKGPLLMVNTGGDIGLVVDEIGRLRAENVVTVGFTPVVTARFTEALQASRGIVATELSPPTTAAPAASATVPLTSQPTASAGNTEAGSSALPDPGGSAAEESAPDTTVAPEPTVASEPTTSAPAKTTADAGSEEPATTLAPATTAPTTTTAAFTQIVGAGAPTAEGPLVLFAEEASMDAYLVLPSLAAGGGEAIALRLNDVDALRTTVNGRVHVFAPAGSTPTQNWQVALAATDAELFGGGTQVFPDRRIVAYYGNPLTFRLGLLGETDPERAVERVKERAAMYEAEGLPPVVPGFEIIATVAATQAGDDGNFSNEMDIEVLRPWIETAMANDVFVILDLQPGRTDFLTQAKIYEEFLRLPNVGLALDPEWRLKPDQRHLRQIGGVSAEEVNAVTNYLATLVREESLPQKILVLHQFQIRMLPDRELIKTVPEVATVVHVDGQGSLGSKYGTWDAMLKAPTDPDQDLWWAWKNFIDEDIPTARPGQVNAVEPLPVIVTYQ